jgi:hypothetical protein
MSGKDGDHPLLACSSESQRAMILSTTPSPSSLIEESPVTCIFCSCVVSHAHSRYRICYTCNTELFNDSNVMAPASYREETKVDPRAVTPLAYLSDDDVMFSEGDDDDHASPPALPKFSSPSPLNVDHTGCVGCMSQSINTVFIPCGHAAMCNQCVQNSLTIRPQEKRCPICREKVTNVVPLYLSGVKMN